MSQSKIEASKDNVTRKAPSLTERIKSTLGAQFFTLRNLCIASSEVGALIPAEARTLLKHVVLGQQNEAQAMIQENPELLLIPCAAIDYSGRTIRGTAFQAALGAGDQPMWEMMLPFFESLEPGAALEQFKEQFPTGIEDAVPAEALKDYYNALAFAIIHHEDHGLSAIETFRQKITAQKEISKGKHFNLQHLLAAYQAFNYNFHALTTRKNSGLFWEKIIGYVQRQMTTYDVQMHCSGLQRVLENNNLLRRGTAVGQNALFPLESSYELGIDFAIYSCDTVTAAQGYYINMDSVDRAHNVLKNYIGAKTNTLAGLRESLEQEVCYQPK